MPIFRVKVPKYVPQATGDAFSHDLTPRLSKPVVKPAMSTTAQVSESDLVLQVKRNLGITNVQLSQPRHQGRRFQR